MTEPQRIGALSAADVRDRLSGPGLALDFGFVKARVRSDVPGLGAALQRVYAEFPVGDADGFFDVTASVTQAGGLRRFVRPQIEFFVDGELPFEPFPADTHLPLLEWGLNWCIAQRSNTHLLLHAGVVEKNGLGIVLPALPGSGKSTLVAALIARGYRLLSDEFGVVRQSDGMLLPLPQAGGAEGRVDRRDPAVRPGERARAGLSEDAQGRRRASRAAGGEHRAPA